jgi:uncharacterized protein (TIGR00369 family)
VADDRTGWEIHDDSGFLGLVGPVLQQWRGEQLVLGFQSAEKHRNRRDAVQGGMLMTLADRAMGSAVRAALPAPEAVATIQLDMQFIAAARLGDFVEAHPAVLRVTRSVVFVEAKLFAAERLVARCSGVWKRLGSS